MAATTWSGLAREMNTQAEAWSRVEFVGFDQEGKWCSWGSSDSEDSLDAESMMWLKRAAFPSQTEHFSSIRCNGRSWILVREDCESHESGHFSRWSPSLHHLFPEKSKSEVMLALLLWQSGALPVPRDVLMYVILPQIAGSIRTRVEEATKRTLFFKQGHRSLLVMTCKQMAMVLERQATQASLCDDKKDIPRISAWCDYFIENGY